MSDTEVYRADNGDFAEKKGNSIYAMDASGAMYYGRVAEAIFGRARAEHLARENPNEGQAGQSATLTNNDAMALMIAKNVTQR